MSLLLVELRVDSCLSLLYAIKYLSLSQDTKDLAYA